MRPQPPLHPHMHPVLSHAPQEPKIIIFSLDSALQAVHHHPAPTAHPCSDWGRARRRVCVIVLEIALTLLSVPHRAAAYLLHSSKHRGVLQMDTPHEQEEHTGYVLLLLL